MKLKEERAKELANECSYENIRNEEDEWNDEIIKIDLQIKTLKENQRKLLRMRDLWRLAGNIKLEKTKKLLNNKQER